MLWSGIYLVIPPPSQQNLLVIPPLDMKYTGHTTVKFFDVRCQSSILYIYIYIYVIYKPRQLGVCNKYTTRVRGQRKFAVDKP